MRWMTALIAAGCGAIGTPDDLAEALAEAECQQIERCALGLYEATYSSDDDCLTERGDVIDDDNDLYAQLDCTFLPDEARACVQRIRGLSCEDWALGRAGLACDLVWSCEDFGVAPPSDREDS
jgi:hypothetical protein